MWLDYLLFIWNDNCITNLQYSVQHTHTNKYIVTQLYISNTHTAGNNYRVKTLFKLIVR